MRKILISLIVLTFMVIYTVFYLDVNQILAFFSAGANTAVLHTVEVSKDIFSFISYSGSLLA
ncbi:MAG: hypothetical protein LWX83_05210 [Anaerolineae bacterium]|nr:hypothetical protein [Anaerolineae bacterium]